MIPGSGIAGRLIDSVNPVNRSHPQLDGAVSLWLCLPQHYGSTIWPDLVGRNTGTLVNQAASDRGWQPTTREHGFADMVFQASTSASVSITDYGLPTGATPRTIVMTATLPSYNGAQTVFSYGTVSNGQLCRVETRSASPNGALCLNVSGAAYGTTNVPASGVPARIVIITGANASSTVIVINGVKYTTTLIAGSDRAVNTVLTGSGQIGSGAQTIGEQRIDGVIVIDHAWTDEQWQSDYRQWQTAAKPEFVNQLPARLDRPRSQRVTLREQIKRCQRTIDGHVEIDYSGTGAVAVNALLAAAIADAESSLPNVSSHDSDDDTVFRLNGSADDGDSSAVVEITPLGGTLDLLVHIPADVDDETINIAALLAAITPAGATGGDPGWNEAAWMAVALPLCPTAAAYQSTETFPVLHKIYDTGLSGDVGSVGGSSLPSDAKIGCRLVVYAGYVIVQIYSYVFMSSGPSYSGVYDVDGNLLDAADSVNGTFNSGSSAPTADFWPASATFEYDTFGSDIDLEASLPFTEGDPGEWELGDDGDFDGSGSYTSVLTSCFFVGDPIKVTMPIIAPHTLVTPPRVVRKFAMPIIAPDVTVTAPTVVLGSLSKTVPIIAPDTIVTAPAVVKGPLTVTPGTIATSGAIAIAPTVRLLMRRTPAIIAPDVTVTPPSLSFGILTKTPGTIAPNVTVTSPVVRFGTLRRTMPIISPDVTVTAPTVLKSVSITMPVIAPQTVITPPNLVMGEIIVSVPTITAGTPEVTPPDVRLQLTIVPDTIAPQTVVTPPTVIRTFQIDTIAPQTVVTSPGVTLGALTVVPDVIAPQTEMTPPDVRLSLSVTPEIIAPTITVTPPGVSLGRSIPVDPIVSGTPVVTPPDLEFSELTVSVPVIAPQIVVTPPVVRMLKRLAVGIIVAGTAVVTPPTVVLGKSIEMPVIEVSEPIVTPPDVIFGPLTVPMPTIETGPCIVIPPNFSGELRISVDDIIAPQTVVTPPIVRISSHATRIWTVPIEVERFTRPRTVVWTVPIRSFRWNIRENDTMSNEVLQKQPAESIVFGFDFSELLQVMGETLASVTSVTATPAGLTLTEKEVNSQSNGVNVRIAGGTTGQMYKVTCLAVTSGGNTIEADGKLYCRNT